MTTDMLPLWKYHVDRLREAHAHFAHKDGEEVWGSWPGEEVIWDNVRTKLEAIDDGDWRVS